MPKISVMIPTFNCGHLVCDAIESVLKQSFTDYEIIVIDDGSTDDTCAHLTPYIVSKKIIYFYQKNMGISGARNRGISLAKGEYVFCLDADDALAPGALTELFACAQRTHAGWVISDIVRVENNHSEIQKAQLPGEEKLMDMLRKKFNFQARFYHKDVLETIGLYDEQQKYYEDWDLYIRLIEKGVAFSYVPQALYFYKIRPQSITKPKNIKRNLFFIERIYRKHYQRIADCGNSQVANLYAQYMWELASDYFHKTHSMGAAFRCLVQSCKYDVRFFLKYLRKLCKIPVTA